MTCNTTAPMIPAEGEGLFYHRIFAHIPIILIRESYPRYEQKMATVKTSK